MGFFLKAKLLFRKRLGYFLFPEIFRPLSQSVLNRQKRMRSFRFSVLFCLIFITNLVITQEVEEEEYEEYLNEEESEEHEIEEEIDFSSLQTFLNDLIRERERAGHLLKIIQVYLMTLLTYIL